MAITQTIVKITQGDQYSVPIIIKHGNKIITDENVTGVRVALGDAVCTYPNGKLTFADGQWLFPLTQEQSYRFTNKEIGFQVQIKLGENIIGSELSKVKINDCIIQGVWE